MPWAVVKKAVEKRRKWEKINTCMLCSLSQVSLGGCATQVFNAKATQTFHLEAGRRKSRDKLVANLVVLSLKVNFSNAR